MSEQLPHQKSWTPTREFYQTDERALQIRDICLQITSRLHELIGDPEGTLEEVQKQHLHAELELQEGKLIELHITPNMHVGHEPDYFTSSPVRAAEYVAGQLIRYTGKDILSENEARPYVEEFNEQPDDELPAMMSPKQTPKQILEFALNTGALWTAEKMLGAETDPDYKYNDLPKPSQS